MLGKKLDKKTLAQYKKILTEIQEKVTTAIKQMSSDASTSQKDAATDSGHALHMADVATDMYDREFSLNLASNDRELLQKIEQALLRIEESSFGICSECQKPISS